MATYKIQKGKEDVVIGSANFSGTLKTANQQQLQYLYETIQHPYVLKDKDNAAKKSKATAEETPNMGV